jgi:hypothetical protein
VVKGEAGVTNSFFLAGTTEEDKWFEKERIQVEESSVEFIGAPLQETNTTKDPR